MKKGFTPILVSDSALPFSKEGKQFQFSGIGNAGKRVSGFTLIELLVVIAIMGLLASIIFVSLGQVRPRSRIAAAQETVLGVVPALTICINSDAVLSPAAGTVPVVGSPICSGEAVWPVLPAGWSYTTGWAWTQNVSFNLVVTGDSKTITCSSTLSGCVTS